MPEAGIGNSMSDSKRGTRWFREDFRKQVAGYGLTTAHILYRRPDHRWLLQSYVWQAYDLFPEISRAAEVSGILAGEAGRPAALRAGRALQADQAGRAARGQRRIPAALVAPLRRAFTLPLVGRVDVRSTSGWGVTAINNNDPHPQPLPTRGREKPVWCSRDPSITVIASILRADARCAPWRRGSARTT